MSVALLAQAPAAIEPVLGWEPSPVVAAGAAVSLLLFLRGFLRLRRRGRGDLAGRGRAVLFVGALAIALLALLSPLHAAGEEYLFSAHMLQHVLVGDLVPLLLLLALRGPLLFHVVPPALMRGRARRVQDAVLRPGVSLGLWTANIAFWHVPFVYELAARNALLHSVEHAAFVAGGLLLWAQLVDPARRRRLSPHQSIAFACAAFVAGQVLVNTLIISDRPLYPLYAEQPVRLLGLSPLADQQAAALVMMAESLLTLGTFVALRVRALVRAPLRTAPERHPFAA